MSGDRTIADSATPTSDLMRPGLRVGGDGRYELLSKLGEGGMGSVWRAKDLKLKREVAIKRIRGAISPALQERFLRETRALTGLSHPNVVTVFDAGEDSYGNYLVMELVSGKTLAQHLKEGPIDPSQSVDLFCAMCRGMSHAHKRGVIHRDLKPSNVMLNDDGVARILDFGLVRLEGSGDLSLSGVGMGTLDYASPEQKQDGGAADERSDVFALGLVFYELLTGRRPSPMHLHKIERPWRDVLERATEPEPAQRYASMDEMLAEVESAKVALTHEAVMTQAMGKEDDLRCPKCRLVNSLEAKFCRSCRESLRQPCPACNAQVRTGLKHCDQCTADIKLVRECREVLAAVPQRLQEGLVSETASMVQTLQQKMRSGALGDAAGELDKSAQACLQKCGEQAKQGREISRKAAELEDSESYEEAQSAWSQAADLDVELREDAVSFGLRLPELMKRRQVAHEAVEFEISAARDRLTSGELESAMERLRGLSNRLERMPQPWVKPFVASASELRLRVSDQIEEAKRQSGASVQAWGESEFELALDLLRSAARLDRKWAAELASREMESVEALVGRGRAREALQHAHGLATGAMARRDMAQMSASIADAKSHLEAAGSRFASSQGWIAEVGAVAAAEGQRLAARARMRRRWVAVFTMLGVAIAFYGYRVWAELQSRIVAVDAEAAIWGGNLRVLTGVQDESVRSAATDAAARFERLADAWRRAVVRGDSGAAEREGARRVYAECVMQAVSIEARFAGVGQKLGIDAVRSAFSDSAAWIDWCTRALEWDLAPDLVASIKRGMNPSVTMAHFASGLGIELDAGEASSPDQIMHRQSGIILLPVQPGVFEMGSTSGEADEKPVHRVQITRPFWIGKTEVTQAQYRAVVGRNPSRFSSGSDADRRPVESVSWNDAVAFCQAMTKSTLMFGGLSYCFRLPTEAEWEFCCRAGTTTDWNCGASLSSRQANCGSNQLKRTVAVGGYAANAWGLFDMHGNVLEWCIDSWDKSANYPSSVVFDPYNAGGLLRVVRGGSWTFAAKDCRSSFRNSFEPGVAYYDIGFRVVLAPVLVR